MHCFKDRCCYLSFIHSLVLKQPKHNTGTEKTKTIKYVQYIQDTKKILRKLQAREANKYYFVFAFLTLAQPQIILLCDAIT